MRPPKAFQALLVLLALFVVVVGAVDTLFGTAPLPGETAVSPEVDSNYRFFSALFLAVGLLLLWIARDPLAADRSLTLRWVCGAVVLGGLARVLSLAVAGPPAALLLLLMAVELVVPPLLLWRHHSLLRRARRPVRGDGPGAVAR
ncbi:DUF4345 domain-containing protein [Nocardiopsis sp. NPDC007018]|uniref:DUF4345 domain-containing protein n=1 Tax=Nocardiopsis sp. NPDC007018 TaxID=3155721 RepID=UPI0033D98669